MKIHEMQELRDETEKKILHYLAVFEARTGLRIDDLQLESITINGGLMREKRKLTDVKIKVSL